MSEIIPAHIGSRLSCIDEPPNAEFTHQHVEPEDDGAVGFQALTLSKKKTTGMTKKGIKKKKTGTRKLPVNPGASLSEATLSKTTLSEATLSEATLKPAIVENGGSVVSLSEAETPSESHPAIVKKTPPKKKKAGTKKLPVNPGATAVPTSPEAPAILPSDEQTEEKGASSVENLPAKSIVSGLKKTTRKKKKSVRKPPVNPGVASSEPTLPTLSEDITTQAEPKDTDLSDEMHTAELSHEIVPEEVTDVAEPKGKEVTPAKAVEKESAVLPETMESLVPEVEKKASPARVSINKTAPEPQKAAPPQSVSPEAAATERRAYVANLKKETHDFLRKLAVEREERRIAYEAFRAEIRKSLNKK